MREFSGQREKMKYFHSLTGDRKMEAFREMVEESDTLSFLGGAGVSTESGIPDFRSKNGLYRKKDKRFSRYSPEYLLSSDCLFRNSEVFFEYFRKNLDCRSIEPNAAHRALSKMEEDGKLAGIVTQNIDGLHQKAGSRKVHEIHGSALRSYCVSCRTQYGADFIFESQDPVPVCPECGRMVRPDVTLYGEFLPEEAHDKARKMIRDADLLIIGGTSLQVGSAAGLARQFHGGRLVIINKSKTLMDGEADLVFHDSIGKVLTKATT